MMVVSMYRLLLIFECWCLYNHNNHIMRTGLVALAEEIVNGGPNGPQANDRFRTTINELNNLGECLKTLALSDQYVFVYATNMIKLIQNGEFCIITETRSEENIVNLAETPSQKSKIYGQIVMAMAECMQSKEYQHYILQSLVDLAGLCLQKLFQDSNNQCFLQSFINCFLPNYKIDERFPNQASELPPMPFEPRRDFDYSNLKGYCLLMKVLISMFEYITVQNGSKVYYEYRRNIYIFRNSYISYFLQMGVEHLKTLFAMGSPENLRPVILLTLRELEAIFMYPFSLSLHEFDTEDDAGDNIAGISSEVHLPSFFRHVLCDQGFLTSLMNYFFYLLEPAQSFQAVRVQAMCLLRIMGKGMSSSHYTFKNQQEKYFIRSFSHNMMQAICNNFKFYDSYYLHSILQIVQKQLTMVDSSSLAIRKESVVKIFAFFKNIVMRASIVPFDGKRNPFSRVFEIIGILVESCKDKLSEDEGELYREEGQQLLQIAFGRITSLEMNQVLMKYGANQPTEIENFCELYEHLLPVFEASLDRNLELFENLDVSRLHPGARIMWLHLCSQLLPKAQANLRQARIILKYYQLASKGDSLASLRYLKTLSEVILTECHQGVSTTGLWLNIEQLSKASFQSFIMNIINICISNFTHNSGEVVDYSLEFFKSIYIHLKKHDTRAFQIYYGIVKELMNAVRTSVFVTPQTFPKRRTFFNVISVIWVNGEPIDYIYEIHQLVSASIGSGTSESFCRYMHDITGIIQPIDRHESFEVVAELALIDLRALFSMHFKDQSARMAYLSDPFFMKIFCKLIVGLVNDLNRKLYFETHTDIPLKIYELIYPLVKQMITTCREIPRQLPGILQKMISLNPLAPLISFESIVGLMREQNCQGVDKLIRGYFENLQRVESINWMYDLIQQNVDFMAMWWEQAIFRNIRPNINLRTIAESRLWTNLRQKETLAKLIFEIGYYDRSYWNVSEFQSQREFVNHFHMQYP